MSKYIIIDWAGNVCFDSHHKPFKTFDDAYDKLMDSVPTKEARQDFEVVAFTREHYVDEGGVMPKLRTHYRRNRV